LFLVSPRKLEANSYVLDNSFNVIFKPTFEEMQEALSSKLLNQASDLQGRFGGECVIFARNFLDDSSIKGYARNIKPNSNLPQIGSVILLKMSSLGHVGVILYFDDNVITYIDSNGDFKKKIAIRTIRVNDKRIKGYKIS
jgi:hypothetical protein